MQRLGLGFYQLSTNEQYAYELLENALKNYRASCDVSRVNRKVDLMKVLHTVLGDNPKIIYFNKTVIRMMSGLFTKQMNFTGCLGKAQVIKKEAQMQKVLEDAVWLIDKKAKNDREILQGISEYLQENTIYDYDELNYCIKGKSKHLDSHTAYGALVNNKAVCDGISAAYALIAQYFGIRCMVVEGKSSFNSSSKVDHAWNIVEYDKAFYHVDSTWDTNTYETTKNFSYNYFGLDDDEISFDHDWDYHTTPICNKDKLSYYVHNSLIAKSESQLENIVLSEIRQGKKVIRLKVSLGIPIPEDYTNFYGDMLGQAFGKAGKACQFNYIWNSRTRCLEVIEL